MNSADALSSKSLTNRLDQIDAKVEIETVDCLNCGGSDFETIIIASDSIIEAGRFRVVRCSCCDLAFTNPRPTPSTIGAFYPDSYSPYAELAARHGMRFRWRRAMTKAVLETHYGYPNKQPYRALLSRIGLAWFRRRRQRQSWFPFQAPGRLLDFGCGAGDFLREMREYGWTVQGIDISETVAKQLHRQTGIPVTVGTLPHIEIPPESFDAVTMWNALEHVHQPREVVRAAGDALRKGGVLVIGVPNLESYGFEWYRQDWHPLDLPRHLIHFTPKTLVNLVEREGFRCKGIDQIGRGGWLRRSARLFTRRRQNPLWLRTCRWRPISQSVVRWMEWAKRADFIRVVAGKK